jgi:hypothetical protein
LARRHVQRSDKPAVKNPKPPEIKPNYKAIIGYRAAVAYERTGVIPPLDKLLDFDPLLEEDVNMWIELFNFYR